MNLMKIISLNYIRKYLLSIKQTPNISVLLATYNNEHTIGESIKSILEQTYENFELLILDDGSTDKTRNIVEEFNDARIRFFQNKQNLGLTKSLNILLKKSNGKYIARQDADDISLKDRFKIQEKYLRHNNSQFCSSRALIKKTGKKIPGLSYYIPQNIVMKYKNPHIHGTIFLEKSVIEKCGGYDENFYYSQDFKLYLDLKKRGIKLNKINKVLYLLNTENNISSSKKSEQNYYFECAKKEITPNL